MYKRACSLKELGKEGLWRCDGHIPCTRKYYPGARMDNMEQAEIKKTTWSRCESPLPSPLINSN